MKSKVFRVLYIIASVIMIIAIIGLTAGGMAEIKRTSDSRSSRYYSEYTYLTELMSGDYGEMYNMAVEDTVRGGKYSEEENCLIALGMYYGYAVDRVLCENAGDAKGVKADEEKMEEWRSRTGKYETYTADIDNDVSRFRQQ